MTQASDTTITVAEYLLHRLSQLGIEHMFTVPGSYVVGLLRELAEQNPLTAVVTASEQEAAYAADAYAKTRGYGVVCGTYGVGSMSAINGLIGSYVERCPVILINGGPSPEQRRQEIEHGILFLHSAGRITTDYEIFRRVTTAAEIIADATQAPVQIDRALVAGMTSKRPVYIEMNQDVWTASCAPPIGTLRPTDPVCDAATLAEAVQDCVARLQQAAKPVLWDGEEIRRFGLGQAFERLVLTSRLPYMTTLPGKAIISEETPGYVGIYDGNYANDSVQAFAAQADLIIAVGTVITDVIGNIVAKDYGAMIVAARDGVRVGHHIYQKVPLDVFLPHLVEALAASKHRAPAVTQLPLAGEDRSTKCDAEGDQTPVTFDNFFTRMTAYAADKLVVTDACFAMFPAAELPRNAAGSFISQSIWLSIGYSVGASVGAALASKRRVIAFTGDGGFREGPQALATLSKHRLPAIICLMNNGVLGIEQFLTSPGYFVHDGTQLDYFNNLAPWNYRALADAFGADYAEIRTTADLEQALDRADALTDRPILLDVVLDSTDLPGDMRKTIPRQMPVSVRRNLDFPMIPRALRV